MKIDYLMIIAKTHERVLIANDKIEFYNNCSLPNHPANKKQQKLFIDELKYFESIESILNAIPDKLERWLELLQADGCNSKSIVMNDIQYLLKEFKESER